jgi:aminomethyltransferase
LANRTPLYDWHLAHRARMVDFAGWDMPVQYTSIIDEHQAVRTGAGLFDISHMGRLAIDGPDALALIQEVYTNDAGALKPGQVRYGLVCNEQGGIRDDVLVYRLPSFWLMVVNASNREKIVAWLAQHRADDNVRVRDMTSAWAMVAVQGPRAVQIVTRVLAEPRWHADSTSPPDQLAYYHALLPAGGRIDVDNLIIVSRTGYTGEDGFEVILPAGRVAALVEDACRIAEEQGTTLVPCGLGARDTLRLEAAMPLYGHELSEDIDPFQAGLSWAVKMEKGDFIGRDTLARRRLDVGLPRRVGIEMEGKRIARERAAILAAGEPVGQVTSGTFAPTLQKAIAMAYVGPAHARVGAQLDVDVRGKAAPARVVPLPFYKRPKP